VSAVRIDLNRLQLNLQGISAELAEETMNGLEAALVRRLKSAHLDVTPGGQPRRLTGMPLDPLKVASNISALDMRDLLVEQIVLALEKTSQQTMQQSNGRQEASSL